MTIARINQRFKSLPIAMSITDRYVGRLVLQYVAIVLGVLLGLFMFVSFIDELGELGVGNYGVPDILWFVTLSIPRTVYDLFPMAALLGSMLGLSVMANDSELVVLRASGVSPWQIAIAVLKIGILLAAVAIVLGEWVTPIAETRAQRDRAQAMQQTIQQQSNFGLWMRDRDSFVNIGEVLPDLTLINVRIFEFDPSGELRSLAQADKGTYTGNGWRLEDVDQTFISLAEGQTSTIETASWNTLVTPDMVEVFLVRADQLSLFRLRSYIDHLKRNNQLTDTWELAFWNKLILPVATAVMVVLALPFVFRQVRSGGLGRSLFIGIMLGLAFYVFSKSFGYIVLAYGAAPWLGAVAPLLIFSALGLVMLRRVA